ncbi:MAG: hypothetical protein MZV70_16425 [Desulfobacterales bacterium]|nr:hypothetical protein [Desulfobacterales bacterium]
MANVCKQNVTRFPYEIARLAEDIAGGLMVTMASEKDLKHPEIGKVHGKISAGQRQRFRGGPHAASCGWSKISPSGRRRWVTARSPCTAPARPRRSGS